MSVWCAHGFTGPAQAGDLAGTDAGQVERFADDEVALLATRFEEEPDPWDSLVAHERVLGRALATGPVVPLRAGHLLHSPEAAWRLLATERVRAVRLLARFAGRVEANVRFTYNEDAIVAEILTAHPQLRRFGRGYAEQVMAGERIAAQLEQKRERESAALLKSLEPLSEQVSVHEPAELTVLNSSFLLRHEQVEAFEWHLGELQAEQAERMSLKYVMPLPFYSFLDG